MTRNIRPHSQAHNCISLILNIQALEYSEEVPKYLPCSLYQLVASPLTVLSSLARSFLSLSQVLFSRFIFFFCNPLYSRSLQRASPSPSVLPFPVCYQTVFLKDCKILSPGVRKLSSFKRLSPFVMLVSHYMPCLNFLVNDQKVRGKLSSSHPNISLLSKTQKHIRNKI